MTFNDFMHWLDEQVEHFEADRLAEMAADPASVPADARWQDFYQDFRDCVVPPDTPDKEGRTDGRK